MPAFPLRFRHGSGLNIRSEPWFMGNSFRYGDSVAFQLLVKEVVVSYKL